MKVNELIAINLFKKTYIDWFEMNKKNSKWTSYFFKIFIGFEPIFSESQFIFKFNSLMFNSKKGTCIEIIDFSQF